VIGECQKENPKNVYWFNKRPNIQETAKHIIGDKMISLNISQQIITLSTKSGQVANKTLSFLLDGKAETGNSGL
jgi:hypothetical protein